MPGFFAALKSWPWATLAYAYNYIHPQISIAFFFVG
jgi:hypothetical protein